MVSSHAQTNSSTGISKNYFPHNCDHVDLKSATLAEICFTYFASEVLMAASSWSVFRRRCFAKRWLSYLGQVLYISISNFMPHYIKTWNTADNHCSCQCKKAKTQHKLTKTVALHLTTLHNCCSTICSFSHISSTKQYNYNNKQKTPN